MRIGLVSLNQAWEDKNTNFKNVAEYVLSAANLGCNLIVFPEMTLTGFSMNTVQVAEPIDNSETIQKFSLLSKKSNIAIVFGVALADNQVCNNLVLVKPSGELYKYAKVHPFSFAKEDLYFQSGNQLVYADVDEFNIGFTICYDLRFPEMYSILAQQCNVIINIANWPNKRIDHWHTLLKSRAIEQQIFMVGVNRVGVDGNGLIYDNSSCVIGPDGTKLLPIARNNELEVHDVSILTLNQYRQDFPTRYDRRLELYLENYKKEKYYVEK